MRISKEGQITIPIILLERYGITPDVDEVEIDITDEGLLIRKRNPELDPIDAIYGTASNGWVAKTYGSADEYMSDVRGYDYATELRKYNDDRS